MNACTSSGVRSRVRGSSRISQPAARRPARARIVDVEARKGDDDERSGAVARIGRTHEARIVRLQGRDRKQLTTSGRACHGGAMPADGTVEASGDPSGTPPPVLEAVGLVKRYGHVTALAGVDLTLWPSEIV